MKGRGASYNPANSYESFSYGREHSEGLDAPLYDETPTRYVDTYPKQIISKVNSPDLGFSYSMNPYQGCEHGCIYCYARNSHEYWGYSAGLDFERTILIKRNAPALLEQTLKKPSWEVSPIVISGNTDCYQPVEYKMELTRNLLLVMDRFNHPVSLITKNALIQRDIDVLSSLASENLVHVNLSLTTLDETLRRHLEPRTASVKQRLNLIENFADAGIPVNLMIAPVIPGLNDHEIPQLLQKGAEAGALDATYTMLRLNGKTGELFQEWIERNYPLKASKVLNGIKDARNGKLNESRFGKRLTGEGRTAEVIENLFSIYKRKFFKGKMPSRDYSQFRRSDKGQLPLFD